MSVWYVRTCVCVCASWVGGREDECLKCINERLTYAYVCVDTRVRVYMCVRARAYDCVSRICVCAHVCMCACLDLSHPPDSMQIAALSEAVSSTTYPPYSSRARATRRPGEVRRERASCSEGGRASKAPEGGRVFVCLYVCLYVYLCVSVCLYVSVCMYVCVSVCVSVCVRVRVSVCLSMSLPACL